MLRVDAAVSDDAVTSFVFRIEVSPEQVDALAPRLREALSANGNGGELTRRAATIAAREERLEREQLELEERARRLSEREAELGQSDELTASERIRLAQRRQSLELSEQDLETREHELFTREAEFEADVLLREDWIELRPHVLPGCETLHEHRPQTLEQVPELDLFLASFRQYLVHRRDREDTVDRVLERLPRIGGGRTRLQAQQRSDRLQVVLHAVVDLLSEHASHHRAAVLERDRCVVRDRREQCAVVVAERCVAVAHELADLPSLPAERQANRVGAGASLRPRDVAVLEHEGRTGRADRLHRRLHDGLERFLDVQRLRYGLGDPRQRLEFRDPPLRLRVQLRVHDRVSDLRGDRDQQVDLVAGGITPRGRAGGSRPPPPPPRG